MVRDLLSAFFHIRTFTYAPKSRCLLDSLTLLEFLAHYGQYPEWVLGVRVMPFGSHAWIQHGAFVLNGTPEYVRAYTPIVVIGGGGNVSLLCRLLERQKPGCRRARTWPHESIAGAVAVVAIHS